MARPRKQVPIPSSEITPRHVYLSRRDWLKTAGIVSAASLLAACVPEATQAQSGRNLTPGIDQTDEYGDPSNSLNEITSYSNYYEFSTNKQEVYSLSSEFHSHPWSIKVDGLVHKPRYYLIEDLLKFEQQERIYRLRCVEGWSMVIPWNGFELNKILSAVEPMTSAKYVKFTTLMDADQFPGQNSRFYPWPYTEGLRLDEAMHRLTLCATGIYDERLPNPNGAPIRLVVPWKYGYKSIKAIVAIELTEDRPATFWNTISPSEYGFYSNVNPEVDHPRWSQRTERRISETSRRDTILFNGYGDEVSSLYSGMDLGINY